MYRPVDRIISSKSFSAPLRRCGTLSDTMLISSPGFRAALSIRMGIMPYVFPADVPPGITFIRFLSLRSFFMAVVSVKPSTASTFFVVIGEQGLFCYYCGLGLIGKTQGASNYIGIVYPYRCSFKFLRVAICPRARSDVRQLDANIILFAF